MSEDYSKLKVTELKVTWDRARFPLSNADPACILLGTT